MNEYGNIIVLRSVFGPNGSQALIQPCKNPKTGMYPSCVRRVDAHGDMVLSDNDKNSDEIFIPETEIIKINHGTTFDLSKKLDAARWEAIKYSVIIAQDINERDEEGRSVIGGDGTQDGYQHSYENDIEARYGKAEYYVEKPETETVKRVSKRQLIHEAESYVIHDELGDKGRKRVCRVLGKDMTYYSDADVKEYLFDICNSTPKKIISLYTSSDMSLRLLLIDSLDKHIIVYKDSLYFYHDNVLGASQDAVIAWMKDSKNKKILDLIKQDNLPDALKPANEEVEKSVEEQKKTASARSTKK